ncbi:MAG: hypothetical protein NTU53_25875 [Planctomycetota bacterium]|nr:hypothetical protein [Planctomycetota bacterium]
MRFRVFVFWLLLCIASGCSTPKFTFVVAVVNKTPLPLSVGLIKNGGQLADGWTSPEQVAINAPQLMEHKWGTLVPPGRTVTIGPHTGAFESGTDASLRIYTGDVLVSAAIAYGRADPGRLDIHLMPGRSGFVINMLSPSWKLQGLPIEDSRPEPPRTADAPRAPGS